MEVNGVTDDEDKIQILATLTVDPVMKLHKIFSATLIIFFAPPILAQLLPPETYRNSGVPSDESMRQLPMSNIQLEVKRLSGPESPQYPAIIALLSDVRGYYDHMPPSDYVLMLAAHAKVTTIRNMDAEMDEFCQRVFATDIASATMEDGIDIAGQLVALEKKTQDETVSTYQSLLANLSYESAQLVDIIKTEMQRNSATAEVDWIAESQRDLGQFLIGRLQGCNQRRAVLAE